MIPVKLTDSELNNLDQNPKIRDLTIQQIISKIANKELEVVKCVKHSVV